MAVPANWLIPVRVRQATSWLPRRTLRAERRRSHLSQSLDMPATADRAAMTRKVAPHASATTMVQIRTGTPNHQPGKDPRVYVWPSSRTRESVRGPEAASPNTTVATTSSAPIVHVQRARPDGASPLDVDDGCAAGRRHRGVRTGGLRPPHALPRPRGRPHVHPRILPGLV